MFCRFIYVRYAKGLLSMGSNLFHGLVFLVSGTFFIHGLFMFPIRNLFLLEDVDLNTIQTRVCTETPIPWFNDVDQNRKFSLKPKLIILAFSTIFLIFTWFFYCSAQRQVKKYRIPNTRRNLMTMKHQTQYLTILIMICLSDQILFMVLQMFYDDLGVENVFLIWWIFHFLEIYLHLYLYILIYLNATRNFEEFNGYSSTRYPNQEKPHQAILEPRRPSHSITNSFCTQDFCISDDAEESNILKCEYCIFNNVQPVYVSPNYNDLLSHIQDDHKITTAWGPVVIQ